MIGFFTVMPASQIYNFLIETDYSNADKNRRYTLIKRLCKTYEVSEVIALRRVQEINELKNMKMKV